LRRCIDGYQGELVTQFRGGTLADLLVADQDG
jgi:hypothetical protein